MRVLGAVSDEDRVLVECVALGWCESVVVEGVSEGEVEEAEEVLPPPSSMQP